MNDDKSRVRELFTNAGLLDGSATPELETVESVPDPDVSVDRPLGSKTCSLCGVSFDDLDGQRQHFKLDWHRYNLKLKVANLSILSEDEFSDLVMNGTGKEDDLASLSGSEDEEEPVFNNSRSQKLYLVNPSNTVFSIQKCLLPEEDFADLDQIPKRLTWAVLMLGGGHFAGAVFQGQEVLIHKTFHCYTVRAKQGGGQSSADNRSGTNHPKSAGASLRRYNEASLAQHVRDIVKLWNEHFAKCHLIFYRAASGNKKLLFSASNSKDKPILDKRDLRVRSIPFPTRRATFKEVKRVRDVLATVQIHGSKDEFEKAYAEPRRAKATSPTKTARIRRSKSREMVKRPLPDIVQTLVDEAKEEEGEDVDSLALEIQQHNLIDNLEEFESKVENSNQLNNDLVTACLTGNKTLLLECIQQVEEDGDSVKTYLNQTFGPSKSTALHLCSKAGHKTVLGLLLEHGGDPTIKDRGKKSPYMLACDKETRNVFRRFQANNQDAFDWQQAHVPTSDLLTSEEEARKAAKKREKRKAQKQAKKEREAEDRKLEEKKRQQEREKSNFLKLSDREKRALAAERRLLNDDKSQVVVQRCFQCAKDITGKTPFEYSSNRFCSPGCVREHRKGQTSK